VRRSWNSVVVFTGKTADQWARESSDGNDGRRMVWAVEAGWVVIAAAALCGVAVR
jgi:hypothetical protein